MNTYITFLFQLVLSLVVIIFFYYYIKLYVFNVVTKIAFYLRLTTYNTVEMAKGVVELPLVVLLHIIFSSILILFLKISIKLPQLVLAQLISYALIGIMLGIGMMGFSSVLCRAIIEIFRRLSLPCFPSEVKDWLIMTRSGWLRHYLHTIDILSLPVALSIVFGQICCEEIVFRGIFIPYFLPAGTATAIISATALFMFMQLFHMPNWISSIFPLVGSMVIGLVNGMLYLKYANIFPLIIAHFSFFIVAVL